MLNNLEKSGDECKCNKDFYDSEKQMHRKEYKN